MAIQMRRGNIADYDPTKIRPGEWAVATDAERVFIGVANGAIEIAKKSDIDEASDIILDAKVKALESIYGGEPSTVATVAEMTNTDLTYIYSGSETGYTAGHWYYWDGTAWTDGGQYASGMILDEISEGILESYVTEGSYTSTGVTTERISDTELKVYGTCTANRRFNVYNGFQTVRTTASPFQEMLPAGTYRISMSANKTVGNPRVTFSYSTYANALWTVLNGQTVIYKFIQPFMFGFYANTNINYGTEEDPTIVTLRIESLTAKDLVARETDTTLAVEGKAADAKTVGDVIDMISEWEDCLTMSNYAAAGDVDVDRVGDYSFSVSGTASSSEWHPMFNGWIDPLWQGFYKMLDLGKYRVTITATGMGASDILLGFCYDNEFTTLAAEVHGNKGKVIELTAPTMVAFKVINGTNYGTGDNKTTVTFHVEKALTVDTALSTTSTNPVQNKAIAKAIADLQDAQFQHGLYGAKWDRTSNLLTRTRDAVGITTDTTNFCHLGSINENYSNPFDDIYPWSDMFVCDVDLTKYRTGEYTLKQCITAVYGDPDFTYVGTENLFVGRYRPEFWHKSIEDADGNVEFLVSQFARPGYKHSPEAIDGVGYCVDVGNNKVTSGSGVPLTNVVVSTIHTRANNNGFTLTDIDALDAQIILYLVEYANWNAQVAIGDGCDNCYRQNAADIISNVTVANGVTVFDVPNTTALLNLLDVGTQVSFGASTGATTYKAIVTDRDGTTVTLDREIAITDGMILSVHGFSSCEFDLLNESVGNASGYIGTRHHANAYYRGASLYANRYRYILGCYRQTQTNHIWICPDGVDPDDYNALNTSVHEDTGTALPTVTTAGWRALGSDAKVVGGLSAFLAVGDESGSSSSPVGDQQYVPLPTVGNTILFFGCASHRGLNCGVAGCDWNFGSGASSWGFGAAPILKSPL